MKIETVIDDFLATVKLEFSEGTWKYYVNHLGHFKRYAERNRLLNIDEVSDIALIDYIAEMKKSCENITINKNIGALKIMYRRMGIDFMYLQNIKKYKVRKKTYDMISEEDLKRIRKYAKNLTDVNNGLLYRALLLILMDTGARIQEVLKIKRRDIRFEAKEILLTHTKTKEDRVVFMSDATVDAVRDIARNKQEHPYLLHNKLANRPANYNDVLYLMKKLKRIMHLEKIHAHMFRHSLATIWLQNGGDIKSVMDYLGHKNIETTERYWHSNHHYQRMTYEKSYKLD